jgi:hypothetical protein
MSTESREKDRKSLQDLAKFASLPVQPRAPAEEPKQTSGPKEDSGMIDLAAMAKAKASPRDEKSASAVGAPRDTVSSTPSYTSRPVSMPVEPQTRRSRSPIWIALGGGVALGAVLAGVLFGQFAKSMAARHAAAIAPPQSAVTMIAPVNDTKTPVAPAARDDRGSEPSKLPAPAATATHRVPAARALGAHPQPGAETTIEETSAAPPPPAAAPQPATMPQPEKAPDKAQVAQDKGNDQSLEALMKRAVGPASRPSQGAPASPGAMGEPSPGGAGNLPLRPASGAVQGAVGAVLPAARYCMAPGDSVSHATITFKSDGSVQGVAITGDSAGQPAEACIRTRLSAARVPPFSSPTFTWSVTVRPAG